MNLFRTLLLASLSLASATVTAADFGNDTHEVYSGDFNSDGRQDLYIKAIPKFIIIAADIVIPISIQPEIDHTLLLQNSDGSYSPNYNLSSTDLATLDSWATVTHTLLLGDFNGDGHVDALLNAIGLNQNSVIVHAPSVAGNSPTYSQTLNSAVLGLDLASGTVTISDLDGDGKADLSLSRSGHDDFVFLITASNKVRAAQQPNAAFVETMPTTVPVSSDEVGTMAGSFRVDESGSATYSIPIMTGPASGGAAPQVSLNYSSQSGNGPLGVGWSIGGQSGITRCRQTYETEGTNRGIGFDANDRFCLDGQKLIKVGGGVYGANGVEYRTEVDSQVRVTSYGYSSANGPDYFEVRRQDGTVSEYGNTVDSVTYANGTHASVRYMWLINKVEDSSSDKNPIYFNYTTYGLGETLLTSIDYSQNNHSIDFNYSAGSRPDQRNSFQAGSEAEQTKRLESVASSINGVEVRTYTLQYQNSAAHGQSQITSIQECNGSVCYEPTYFAWEDAAAGFEVSASVTTIADDAIGAKPADLNGDGRQDLVWVEQSGSDFWVITSLANGTGYNSSSARLFKLDIDHLGGWHILDYNNDGRDDLLYAYNNQWYIRTTTTSGTFGSAQNIGVSAVAANYTSVGDYNGDGLADLAYYSGSLRIRYLEKSGSTYAFGSEVQYTINAAAKGAFQANITGGTFKVVDVNGDGLVDLMGQVAYLSLEEDPYNPAIQHHYQYYWSVLVQVPGSSQLDVYWEYPDSDPAHLSTASTRLRPADFNSDGLTDLFFSPYNGGNRCMLNTGETLTTCGGFTVNDLETTFMGDYDHDGNIDVFYFVNNVMKRREWDPTIEVGGRGGFGAESTPAMFAREGSHPVSDYQHMMLDVNGDARADHVAMYTADASNHSGTPNKQRVYLAKNPMQVSNVIEKITNGLGAETDITYKSIFDPNAPGLYTKQTDAATKDWSTHTAPGALKTPVLDLKAPMYVVQSVASSSPLPGNSNAKSSINYAYEGAKLQGSGRGFLGFHKVATTDNQTGIETTTTYHQKFPLTGMPESTVVRQSNEDKISESTNLYVEASGSCGTGSTRRPYVYQSIEKSYDLNDESLKSTVTTSITQDACGNATSVTVATTDGSNTYTTLTTNTYDSSFDLFEGRLEKSVVKHSRTNETDITRTSEFEYDPTTRLLTKEIIEPNSGTLTLTTSYIYDSFGNKKESTTSAAGYDSRKATAVYDSDGQVVDQKKDAYDNVVEQVTARNALLQPTVVRDQNQNEMRILYGALGRKYYEQNDTGGNTTTAFISCSSPCSGEPSGTAYMVEVTGSGKPTQRTYFDKIGREVRTRTQGFDGSWINVDTQYDNLGRVKQKSEPYYDGGSIYWSIMTYDILGRVTNIEHPDDSDTSTSYDGTTDRTVTVTNDLGQVTVQKSNALGEVIEITDALGGKLEYEYDAQGNLREVTAPGNVVTTMAYNLRGQKISMSDPDKGNWAYSYTPFGELETQLDAKGQHSRVWYDKAGRMVQRTDRTGGEFGPVASDAIWSYHTTGPVETLGKLDYEDIKIGGSATADIARSYTYDEFGRAESVTSNIAGQGTFTARSTYDELGRVFQQFDASNYLAGQQISYNTYGYPYRVSEAGLSAHETYVYSEILAMDARGQVTLESIGGITSTRYYDAETGRISGIVTNSGYIQDLAYTFDVLGNLTSRSDTTVGSNFSETFTYDGLNRLKTTSSAQASNLTINYDAAGNITSKSNVQGGATYNYGVGSAGPHAVTSVGGLSYTYDANGNMISGDGRSINYTTFDKPASITKGGHNTAFLYGPNRSRFKRTDTSSGQTTTTVYLGNVERITKPSGEVVNKRYIGSKNIVTTTSINPAPVELAVFTDHLGSTHNLVNRATGVSSQVMSFDAFGLRRASNWTDLSPAQYAIFNNDNSTKGFTGHEQMDQTGLIHMNGRVYDPVLGRFISADPFIDGVKNTQGYNRYSYVQNNPLSYTDPSGHFAVSLLAGLLIKGAGLTALEIGITMGVAGFLDGIFQGVGVKAALQSGVVAGVSAFAFAKIGSHFNDAGLKNLGEAAGTGNFSNLHNFGGNLLTTGQVLQQVSAHAIVGGIATHLQGGKFGHGFVSAGLTKGIMGKTAGGSIAGRLVATSVVGGTTSRISGGKFANGAKTGAFQFLFNEISEKACSGRSCGDRTNRFTRNNIDGLTEADVRESIANGTGWKRELRDAWHNMGVEPGTNRKYTHMDGREAVFTTNAEGLSVHVTDHNGPTFNYGKNDFSHTILDVIPYFFQGAGPNDHSTFWDRITVCTIACSLD